jgi:hypothetical protein
MSEHPLPPDPLDRPELPQECSHSRWVPTAFGAMPLGYAPKDCPLCHAEALWAAYDAMAASRSAGIPPESKIHHAEGGVLGGAPAGGAAQIVAVGLPHA